MSAENHADYSVAEAAWLIGKKTAAVRSRLKKGSLTGKVVEGRQLVDRDQIEKERQALLSYIRATDARGSADPERALIDPGLSGVGQEAAASEDRSIALRAALNDMIAAARERQEVERAQLDALQRFVSPDSSR